MAGKGPGKRCKEASMPYTARHRFARISPTKVRPIANVIKGMPVPKALETLQFSPKRGAKMLEKVLRSAVANAGLDAEPAELFVQDARVDGGPVAPGTKRWIPVSRGMAHPIRRRTSHILVTVEETSSQGES